MNIAHILPRSVTLPLTSHNGRYDWVVRLALLQAKDGHAVTVYCNPDSVVPGVNIEGTQQDTGDKKTNNIETFRLALQHEHDIYHSHFDELHYEIAHETQRSIVYTQHWWPGSSLVSLAQKTAARNVWAVPPTKYMYDYDTQTGIASKGYIYHGIDLAQFYRVDVPGTDRLLFVSRISPEKNLGIAIMTAQKSGFGLDIIGKIADKNQAYWQSLLPMIDGTQIRYLGPKNQKELREYYTAARAVLFPSDVNEPFGLVAIEAQACGTPVIMKRGGSRGELIEDGRTGILCDSDEDFVAAATFAGSLEASDCVRFAQKFDVNEMAKQYELLYEKLTNTYDS